MSALAQFHVWSGGQATGSDRAFDAGGAGEIRRRLEAAGVRILPQDGSGVAALAQGAADRADRALVVSTAVEDTVPDVRAAREHGITILHRSELLARFVEERRTIAVSGTSGKSTVTAMIFEILRAGDSDPSVITGGDLLVLQQEGLLGNAWAGSGEWLVIEADESDGSLVRYRPWLGVLLNLQRDHKEPEALIPIFDAFRRQTRGPFVLGEDANLDRWRDGARTFGFGERCEIRATDVRLSPAGSTFRVGDRPTLQARAHAPDAKGASASDSATGAAVELRIPGLHNVRNALAAMAACRECGVDPARAADALRDFRGVARRFQPIGQANGREVVDDFAHNPDKIRASLDAARLRARRILAVYQPHGFGPTRFLRGALIESFCSGLTPDDRLYMPEIFYAGGTATRDISSRDIVEAVAERGIPALFREDRRDLVEPIARDSRPGDIILVMGARDPSLTAFCREILERIRERDRG